ncbi:MAG: PH domain-containing protein [Salinibacterium sp.]|nr:PH domain-containing protein [Salinibacterium sp.]
MFWFPSVRVAEDMITVRNVFLTVRIPWAAIQNVDTKYALTITTSSGTITAWASPAPNRYAAQVGNTADARLAASATGPAVRPGDLLSTASGAPAYLIRRHWEELREDGVFEARGDDIAVTRDIHWTTIAVLGSLTIATVLGVLL